MAAQAQEDAPPIASQTQTLHVTSRLVVLDVVVVDRAGKPVTNLDRSQFSVFEDKAPQTIKNFDPPSGHAMPAGSDGKLLVNSSADLPKIGDAPVNVLVFDELNTPFRDLAYARQMMEKYLRAQPEVLPVPTLFVAAGNTKIAVLHDYTQSRADLLASVKTHTADLDFTQVMSSLNGKGSGNDVGLAKTLGALSQLAASVKGVPGRKNILWVGSGYRKASDLNNMSESDRDRVVAVIRQVTDRMLAARVTLYTIDPEGVVSQDPSTPDQVDSPTPTPALLNLSGGSNMRGKNMGQSDANLSFESFAIVTGGRVIGGRNDLDVQIAQTAEQGTRFYTLSYVPASANDAERPYREIRVVTKDPSLHVITREGYFGGEAPVSAVALTGKAKQPQDVKFDLLNAARTVLVYNGLHMAAQPSKRGYTLLVNANDLKFEDQPDGSRMAEVTVVAVCYNDKGKETAQHAAELKERLEATDRIGPQSQVGFDFPMVLPPFTSRLRFVMRDAGTGTLGSANAKP